ncbi:hypothetical protein B0T11DRAFT_81902 [Plectosphaerella cucumerina]|uniref:Uncharacterized protein n=1 Tax=Plectosphaerella cucumerina TaxID=40658 RepID=A0A8K0X3I1_9PEZI|nr:hypothetical protein B0T11DRAFT_81902 [Plectosphaerella cucumerina]
MSARARVERDSSSETFSGLGLGGGKGPSSRAGVLPTLFMLALTPSRRPTPRAQFSSTPSDLTTGGRAPAKPASGTVYSPAKKTSLAIASTEHQSPPLHPAPCPSWPPIILVHPRRRAACWSCRLWPPFPPSPSPPFHRPLSHLLAPRGRPLTTARKGCVCQRAPPNRRACCYMLKGCCFKFPLSRRHPHALARLPPVCAP